MPMINMRAERDPNDELLARGVADFGVSMIEQLTAKRLNNDRTVVEQRIKEAGTYQDALSVIENAPWKVKNTFGDELRQRAQERFPEQELISVLTPDGGIRRLSQEKNRPLTDQQIEEQGFQPATQHLIVSTDPKTGEIEIHDTALGMTAAGEDMERLKEMFPDRDFQITQAPETETFMSIREQQLRAREISGRQAGGDKLTTTDRIFNATVQQEIENDPLATEQGVAVLQGAREDIIQRFRDFNGQFAAGVYSLDSPESAPLVQNGISVTSQLVARGYNQERAVDVGLNLQIAGSVVKDLMQGQALNNGVQRETERRFGVNPQALSDAMQAAANSPDFAEMAEFDPKASDPDVFDVTLQGQSGSVTIRFAKINGKLVPLGKR